MKIATFNINNINRRLPNLLAWLKTAKPDVVCLQELKAEQGAFPAADLAKAGYMSAWKGQRTWNGVAILSRGVEPVITRTALPGDPKDTQSRYIEAAVDGVLIGCIYLPNGNPQPGPKFDYKLAWFKRLHTHARKLLKSGAPVILAGDYNVAPTEIDIYPTKSWDKDALVHPASRAAFAKLVAQGWTDSLRELYPDERLYTFWHYWRNSWQRNAGLRIDHLLLSPSLAKQLRSGGVDRAVRGKPEASDHAPVWIELGAVKAKPRKQTARPAASKKKKPGRVARKRKARR
ncbi:MAG TPA: exodeoxyribonuclease III [Pseudolabrys sp.]|nr:exodeoxyribonuclease III [Pseudolabrys sp.]